MVHMISIETPEMLVILHSLLSDARAQYQHLTNFPVMCAADEPGVRYTPPTRGILHLEVRPRCSMQPQNKILSSSDLGRIFELIKNMSTGRDNIMLEYAMRHTVVRFHEAFILYKVDRLYYILINHFF